MTDTVTFDLVSPERLLRSSEVYMVVVPGAEGDFGVLAQHAPFMSTLRPGPVDVYETQGSQPERLFVAGGFAEISENRLTILAEEAQPIASVDLDAARQRLKDTKEDLSDTKDPIKTAKLQQSITQLEVLISLAS